MSEDHAEENGILLQSDGNFKGLHMIHTASFKHAMKKRLVDRADLAANYERPGALWNCKNPLYIMT